MIAFDIDGVVLDFASMLQKHVLIEFGVEWNKSTYYVEIPGVKDHNGFKEEIDKIVLNNVDTINAIPKAIESLELFYKYLKTPIRFFTARSNVPEIMEVTQASLERHLVDIEFDVVYVGEHKKDEYLTGYRHFVDDQQGNLLPALNKNIITCGYLIDQPWNQKVEGVHDGMIRISNLETVWNLFYNREKRFLI